MYVCMYVCVCMYVYINLGIAKASTLGRWPSVSLDYDYVAEQSGAEVRPGVPRHFCGFKEYLHVWMNDITGRTTRVSSW